MAGTKVTRATALQRHRERTGLTDEQVAALTERLLIDRLHSVLQFQRCGMPACKIGARLNITANRVYQLERQALHLIKHAAAGDDEALENFAPQE